MLISPFKSLCTKQQNPEAQFVLESFPGSDQPCVVLVEFHSLPASATRWTRQRHIQYMQSILVCNFNFGALDLDLQLALC